MRLGDHRRAHREAAEARYRKALVKGVIKAISRMGISTVHSYHGAQVFEALGLNRDFVDEYFTWTPTRIGGIGIEVVSREVKLRQDRAYPPKRPIVHRQLGTGGQYQYRADGERHLFNPLTIHTLQQAVRTGDYATFKDYTRLVDDQSDPSRDPARPPGAPAGATSRARSTRWSRSSRSSAASRPAP